MKEQLPNVQAWVEELEDRGLPADEKTFVERTQALMKAINMRKIAVTDQVYDELAGIASRLDQLSPGSPLRQRLAAQGAYQAARIRAARSEGGPQRRKSGLLRRTTIDPRGRVVSEDFQTGEKTVLSSEESQLFRETAQIRAHAPNAPAESEAYGAAKAAAESGFISPEQLAALTPPEYARMQREHPKAMNAAFEAATR